MKQIFDQFLHFLQQGIAAIFRFVDLVWTWSLDQIAKMTQAPWGQWPLWKQIVLIVVIALVAWALLIAARRLWFAAVRVLAAFVHFLGALVYTLPMILLAGVFAVGGLWVINNLNVSSLPTLTVFERSNTAPTNDNGRQSSETSGKGDRQTTGSSQ